jgi:uncharacterized protein YegJ (DUF2314 family)
MTEIKMAPHSIARSIILGLGLLCSVHISSAEDKVVSVATDDPEMNAAIDKARSTLPYFWQHLANRGEGEQGFFVKIRITDGDAVEHFWCGPVVGTANKATCNIDNDPQSVSNVKLGQEMSVEKEYISDWNFMRDDRIIGGETIKVILRRLPKEEADQLGLQFGEL